MNVEKTQQPKPVVGTLAYIYAARRIRVEHSSQRHHLLDLASRSNKLGQCYATIETLADDQRVSPDTIHKNNRYWQERGALTWVVGSSNQYRREANAYQLNLVRMEQIVRTQPAKTRHRGSAEELLSRTTGVQQTSAEPHQRGSANICSAAPEGLLRPAGAFAEPHQRVTKNTSKNTSKNTYIDNNQEETDFDSSVVSAGDLPQDEINEAIDLDFPFEDLSPAQQTFRVRQGRLESIQHILDGSRFDDDSCPLPILLNYFGLLTTPESRIELFNALNAAEQESLMDTPIGTEMAELAQQDTLNGEETYERI